MLTIKNHKPTEHKLRTFTQIDITSDIPCNPECVQQKYTITPEICNDLIDDS